MILTNKPRNVPLSFSTNFFIEEEHLPLFEGDVDDGDGVKLLEVAGVGLVLLQDIDADLSKYIKIICKIDLKITLYYQLTFPLRFSANYGVKSIDFTT